MYLRLSAFEVQFVVLEVHFFLKAAWSWEREHSPNFKIIKRAIIEVGTRTDFVVESGLTKSRRAVV